MNSITILLDLFFHANIIEYRLDPITVITKDWFNLSKQNIFNIIKIFNNALFRDVLFSWMKVR